MGYTTNFSGKFKLNRELTVGQYNEIIDNFGNWDPSNDGLSIEHNGGEKDYTYEEDMNNLIKYLESIGIKISGEVKYQGEKIGDVGVIKILDGECEIIESIFSGEKIICPCCEEEFYIEQAEKVGC